MSLFPHHLYVEPAVSRASSVFDGPSYERDQDTPEALSTESHRTWHSALEQASATLIVISGGTGCNAICSAFSQAHTCYVLPVTDDGGSSSEIIRVIGGPSIGDIRSRLIRLIPTAADSSVDAIRNLLSYRFPSHWSEREAREAWRDVVEGRSTLWKGIPPDRKELIRGFLVSFEAELLKRSHKNFSFRNGSIGNFFLSAAQLFFRSLPSAIFQFSCITQSQGTILPVLVTNHTVTIAAELEDGSKIIGQCNISHPVKRRADSRSAELDVLEGLEDDHDLASPVNFEFHKTADVQPEPLDARICRVFYINAYGQEIYPSPNPDFLANIRRRNILVYSCGSLWTSIIPCLALRGVATAIAQSSSLQAKILLLNYTNDRETMGYTALDYITAITNTLNRHDLTPRTAGVIERPAYPASAFITHLVYVSSTTIFVEKERLASLGVNCISVTPKHGVAGFDADAVEQVLNMIIASL